MAKNHPHSPNASLLSLFGIHRKYGTKLPLAYCNCVVENALCFKVNEVMVEVKSGFYPDLVREWSCC